VPCFIFRIGLVAANLGGEISIYGLLLIVLPPVGTWQLIKNSAKLICSRWSFEALSLAAAIGFVVHSGTNSWSVETISHISWLTIGAISLSCIVNPAWFAHGLVLSYYPAATVALFTLLVPIFQVYGFNSGFGSLCPVENKRCHVGYCGFVHQPV
jgi:O-acetylserine/cysteine efflux transporter